MDGPYDIIEEKRTTDSGETVLRRYQKGRFLGKGGFAKCYEVKDIETGRISAAKIIEKASLTKGRARQKLMSEIKIHKAMSHPNVVKFENYFEDAQRAYIILELCPNQTLKEMVKKRKKLHELEAQFYMQQLVSGLKYIHEQKVIHRDLKLGNLFVGRNLELKVGDFGLAAKLDFPGERRRTICGTPNYIAPEVLNSKICGHSFEADIWSVGVVLYAMLVGKPPFETSNVKATYRRIKANEYSIPEDAGLSGEAKSLIEQILVLSPTSRPTLDDIQRHPFMTKNPIPRQLPITSLAFPLSGEFISQYVKIDKNESSKLLSSTTTATSMKKTLLEAAAGKDVPPKSRDLEQARAQFQTQSQRKLEIRAVTATRPAQPMMSSTRGFLKTNNYMTGTCTALSGMQHPSFQAPKSVAVRPVVLASKKSTSGLNKMLGTGAIRPQASAASIQSSMLANNTTANLNALMGTARAVPATAVGTARSAEPAPIEYVMYYQDYTEKYGIGYILTNGTVGFYYNDMTNMLWIDYRRQYAYSDFYAKGDKAPATYMVDAQGNREVEKKIKILSHFRSWCQKLRDEGKTHFPIGSLPSATGAGTEVALKRVVKTKNGILLRFTNGVVQMIFLDQSQIVLCFKNKALIYISKKGVKQTMKITNEILVTAGEKVVKRFKYTLNILSYLNSNKGIPMSPKQRPTHDRRPIQAV